MARKVKKTTSVNHRTTPLRGIKTASSDYLEKLETQIESNQSKVSMVLGALIILVIGVLVFNYFNRNKPSLGPAQQTGQNQQGQQDVSQNQLPGSYTVKEGDTLFTIAEKYFSDGGNYQDIAKANNLTDPNQIEAGQVLQIPKLAAQQTQASSEPAEEPASPAPTAEPVLGTGGGNSTIWGSRIEENTYTVVEGDWLSKIAGRAYGNIMAYNKIAQANNIPNPDHIEPGMVLTIPR